ncbi:MAG: ATP-binding protein, partial [Myxococcota bacterium]
IAAIKPKIDPNLTLPYAINTVLEPGLRGVGIVGLLAVIMSSADSYLHSAAVSLVHDVIQPLRKCPFADSKELRLTRIVTFALGACSMVAAISFNNVMELVLLTFVFWNPIVVVPLLIGITGSYSSARSFVVAASCGAFAALVWQYLSEPYASVHAAIPGMLANWFALSIARQFDTSKNIHYDPDDPLSSLAKRKRLEFEQAQAEGKVARVTVTAAMQRVCRRIANSCWKLLLSVWICLPTPSRVVTFCRRRTLLYHISYEKFAAATLVGCFLSYIWRNPDQANDLFGIGLRLLCIGLAFGLLLHKHFISHKWQEKGLPLYWLFTLVLPWHVSALYNFLSGKGHVGDFGLWMSGVLLTAVLIDVRGFLIVAVYSTLFGWLLYRLFNGQHSMWRCLKEIPVGMLLSSVMNMVVVMLFARSREVSLQQQMMAYQIKEGCTAHDLPAPLNRCQKSAKKLQEHMPDLVKGHKKACEGDASMKPKSDETYEELLQLPGKIDASAQRGKDFVREMLGEHRDPFKESTQSCCSIAQCVQDALDYSDLSLEDLGRIHWKGGDFLVRIKPYLMAHAVYNALKNAAKNSPPGTIIEIWAAQERDMSVLCVRNEGSIASHRLLAVQEIFESDTEGGHGMGLPYCRLAAQVAGGDISLSSTEELGTSLRFELPRLPDSVHKAHADKLTTSKKKKRAI